MAQPSPRHRPLHDEGGSRRTRRGRSGQAHGKTGRDHIPPSRAVPNSTPKNRVQLVVRPEKRDPQQDSATQFCTQKIHDPCVVLADGHIDRSDREPVGVRVIA